MQSYGVTLKILSCRNTQVVVRMKQYKDDLLSSCLQLVLSLPNELVVCDMDVIIPALKVNMHSKALKRINALFIVFPKLFPDLGVFLDLDLALTLTVVVS